MTSRRIRIVRRAAILAAVAVFAAAATAVAVADPTPVLPSVRLESPSGPIGAEAAAVLPLSPVFTLRAACGRPDDPVARYRWVLKTAALSGGGYATTREAFEAELSTLLSFGDFAWQIWRPWPEGAPSVDVALAAMPYQKPYTLEPIYYLFAAQVMTRDGVVSFDRDYGGAVANFRVLPGVRPALEIAERWLGRIGPVHGTDNYAAFDVAGGQVLAFSWAASAERYEGTITSYRWGWNVADPDDPLDPGWALPPGLTPEHQRTPAGVSFASGVQKLTVQAVDDFGRSVRCHAVLTVVPVPAPADQFPLLLVDDVPDHNSRDWLTLDYRPLDLDAYRDAFWAHVLGGSDGVAGWSEAQHAVDTTLQPLAYRDAIRYRALLWTVRWAAGSATYVGEQFRPDFNSTPGDIDRYVWLAPYQEHVGNVLLAGSRALDSHLAQPADFLGTPVIYETPVVFQSQQGDDVGMVRTEPGSIRARRGFGRTDIPGVGERRVGPTRYPFLVLGVSMLDVVSGFNHLEYDTGVLLGHRRNAACVGLKGLVVDPAFKAAHFAGEPSFTDTIWTEPTIDWQDRDPYRAWPPSPGDVLRHAYRWRDDEFYDADIVGRGTPHDIQQGPAWGCDGPCVEPIFRSLARFDWVRAARLVDNPDDTWPEGHYGGDGQPPALDVLCGPAALHPDRPSARTNDRTVGFISRKTAPGKPSGAGDVVFGFDPYRFDHDQMARVIRWVLGEHFGLAVGGSR